MAAGPMLGMRAGELKGIQAAHPTSYSQGFVVGLDSAIVVPEDPRRLNIVVPEVVLPAHLQALLVQQEPTAQPEVDPSKAGSGAAKDEDGGGEDDHGRKGKAAAEAGKKGHEAITEQKKDDPSEPTA